MTAAAGGLSFLSNKMRAPLQSVGGFFRMCVLTAKALTQPFQWKEFILQCWFLLRVAFLPTLAVAIPMSSATGRP